MAGGGIGMGKTCEPKAFSFQCMTKFTTNKTTTTKKNSMKQKNNGVNFFFGSVVTRIYVYVTVNSRKRKTTFPECHLKKLNEGWYSYVSTTGYRIWYWQYNNTWQKAKNYTFECLAVTLMLILEKTLLERKLR